MSTTRVLRLWQGIRATQLAAAASTAGKLEGDRNAAFTELRRAAEDYRKHHRLKYLRQAFDTAEDFEPARTDPEFLALLKE